MSLLYNGTPISKVSYNGTDLSSLTYNGNELIDVWEYNHYYHFPASDGSTNMGGNTWNGFNASGSATMSNQQGPYAAFNSAKVFRTSKTGSGAYVQLKFPFEVEFRSFAWNTGATYGYYLVNGQIVIDSDTISVSGRNSNKILDTPIRGDTVRLKVTSSKRDKYKTGDWFEFNSFSINFYAKTNDIVNWQNQYGLTFERYEVTA